MISVTKSDTPFYLRSSELYISLQDDLEGEQGNAITIPKRNFKIDENITSHDDLINLCHTLRYWGVKTIPETVMKAAYSQLDIDWKAIVNEFGTELTYIKTIARIRTLIATEPINVSVCEGLIEVVTFLHKHGFDVPQDVCPLAAQSGHRNILEYFHKEGFSLVCQSKTAQTIIECYIDGCEAPDVVTCDFAARAGHLDCLQYAHDHGCSWNEATCASAAEGGHLECLQYAHDHGCPFDGKAGMYASMRGHLDCLRYLHEKGLPWDVTLCSCASETGKFECLRFLHENGCPWDHFTCLNAAINGHQRCLMYAHDHGCPWSVQACLSAVQRGITDKRVGLYEGCMEYILEQLSSGK